MGWGNDDPLQGQQASRGWIREARAEPLGGAWSRLGPVARPGEPMLGRQLTASFPPGVIRVDLDLFRLVPSHTIMVLHFTFDDVTSRSLDAAVRQPLRTKMKKKPGGVYTWFPPYTQKEEVVRQARDALVKRSAEWIRAHFPGAFSRGASDGLFPRCEFVTLKEGRPFEEGVRFKSYLWILGLGRRTFVFSNTEYPGLRLANGARSGESEEDVLVLSANEAELFAGENMDRYAGGRTPWGFANRLESFSPLVAWWSLCVQVRAYERRIARIRDTAFAPAGHLRTSAKEALALRGDVIPFVHDVKRLRTGAHSFVEGKWESRDSTVAIPRYDLLKGLQQELFVRTDVLGEAVGGIGETITAAADIQVAETNKKLQWVLTILTGILVALTAALVWLTILLTKDSSHTQLLR